MLKVHAWLPEGNMVGHASLSYGGNYVSFLAGRRRNAKELSVTGREIA